MEYCYSGTESLWYWSCNRHVCCKGKCAADRHSRSTGVNPEVGSRGVALRRVFNLKLSRIHMTKIIIKIWVIEWEYVTIYMYELNWDANFFFPVESKDCMNSASYEYRNMSARRGARLVPIGMPTIYWKTFLPKTTEMLSTRNSSMLMMSSAVYLFFESECSLTKEGVSWPKPEICICDFHFCE